jgi:TatD DNase family protein
MTKSTTRIDEDHDLVFIDTHCHLDDESFASDISDVVDRSRSLGVTRWINVGFNPDRWTSCVDLASRFQGMSYLLGVHPGDADIWDEGVHAALRDAIQTYAPVAIGEIGLDFYRGETNHETQIQAFNAQLDLALEHSIPAAIHMRDAESLLLDVVSNRQRNPVLLFHSYDGSEALTDWIIGNGCYVGVGGLATRKKAVVLQRQLRHIPLSQIVLETDSPYLVPNGFKHRRNTPESIPVVANALAKLLDQDLSVIAQSTTANAEQLFERLRHQ